MYSLTASKLVILIFPQYFFFLSVTLKFTLCLSKEGNSTSVKFPIKKTLEHHEGGTSLWERRLRHVPFLAVRSTSVMLIYNQCSHGVFLTADLKSLITLFEKVIYKAYEIGKCQTRIN